MKVILFGATGMVGQGVLRECLLDPDVGQIVTVGRSVPPVQDPALRCIVHTDMWNYESIEAGLTGYDACFFCVGVTSAGRKEEDYARVTYGIAMAAAESLCRLNPRMTFVFVSALGADSSERGRMMWARVKGKTENALLRLPFKAVYIFRPGFIQPLDGIRSRTALYRVLYVLFEPLMPLLLWAFPNHILTTAQIGRAMLAVARHGAPKRVLEPADISALMPD